MSQSPINIRILSDGKPGHVNQSMGLALALANRVEAQIETIEVGKNIGFFQRLKKAAQTETVSPDIIIAAGHRTHLPLLWASRKLKAKSVLLMSPSLPARLFDFIVAPEHDDLVDHPHTIKTSGALNRIPEDIPTKSQTGLILIGGPSEHFEWNEGPLLKAIQTITSSSALQWTITDSRRTPASFLGKVKSIAPDIAIAPSSETPAHWLPDQLINARETWVTPDSASMVFEALTAQSAVGILPLDTKTSTSSRVARSVQDLLDQSSITAYADWTTGESLPPPQTTLHEASRCAEKLIEIGLLD